MTGRQMYGVVLWSDDSEKKAVIWCEDHGNLAYYTQGERTGGADLSLDAGDLIQFDVSEVRQIRLAHNLRLVGEDQYPNLAERLVKASPVATVAHSCHTAASNSNVVHVHERRRA